MIYRVFPRSIPATTPKDIYSHVGFPPANIPADVTEIHISVTFSFDLAHAERLVREYQRFGVPVKIGGPATGMRGEEFVPGRYLKKVYTITSRGCPNRCWFCSVPKREGDLRELPIADGWNVLDDNLLACSDEHIKSVFEMLARQSRRPEFTGGLESKRLLSWHANAMKKLKTKQVFFAYDTPDDWEPLIDAAKTMLNAGFTRASKSLRAYVLIGFPKDTFEEAEKRLKSTLELGVVPMAMLWMDDKGRVDPSWKWFQRMLARPAIISGARS